MKIKGGGKHSEFVHPAKYIKSIVYGGLDGIITTFAIVAGVAGAALSANIILILGFANLIADGISMAAGDYLGTKSEIESHKNKTLWKDSKLKRKFSRLDKGKSPIKNSVMTFISFAIFGLIPLLAYVLQTFNSKIINPFFISIILTAIALFILGSVKTKLTGKNWFKSGAETLVIGGVAASAAYYIGKYISNIV
tara:strand:- start:688 stop:1272 length:585 start_codon:yes stop_codon:yes gene_type:complete